MNKKEQSFVECLRLNIEENWNEGGLFESMTKDDCLKACDRIEQLQAKNKRLKEALEGLIKESHKNDRLVSRTAILRAEKALKGESKIK